MLFYSKYMVNERHVGVTKSSRKYFFFFRLPALQEGQRFDLPSSHFIQSHGRFDSQLLRDKQEQQGRPWRRRRQFFYAADDRNRHQAKHLALKYLFGTPIFTHLTFNIIQWQLFSLSPAQKH